MFDLTLLAMLHSVSVSSQMATFLVLLSSVAGSIITAFAVLVKQLEAKFDMREDSDQTSEVSAKTPDSDPGSDPSAVGIEMAEFVSVQKPETPQTMIESKFARLEQKIDQEIAMSQSKTFRELAMAEQIKTLVDQIKSVSESNQHFQEEFIAMRTALRQVNAELAHFSKQSDNVASVNPTSSIAGTT
jgi:ATP-dependent Lon protease